MPKWVKEGYEEYAKRLPRSCQLILKEIPCVKRSKSINVNKVMKIEGDRILDLIVPGSHLVLLDLAGKSWSTRELSGSLQRWMDSGQNINLVIGGPDGLADHVRQQSNESWCLSNLTFPHPIVRVIVAEQLYRAWSILNHHPYHK